MRFPALLRPSVLASLAAHAAFVAVAVAGAVRATTPIESSVVPTVSFEARETDVVPEPEVLAPPADPAPLELPPFVVPPETVVVADDPPALEPPETTTVSIGAPIDAPPIGLRVASRRGRTPGTSAVAVASPAGPGGAGGRAGRVVAPPRPLATIRPAYPADAVANGWEGLSVFAVTVTADGRVAGVALETSSGYPILDGAAERAIAEWTFSPALVDGVAADVTVRVPVRFRL